MFNNNEKNDDDPKEQKIQTRFTKIVGKIYENALFVPWFYYYYYYYYYLAFPLIF